MSHLIEIYTDGSSFIKFKEGYYEASSSVIIYIDGEEIYSAGAFHQGGTNSLGEVYALVIGLSKLKDILYKYPEYWDNEIYVFADSDYVVKSVQSYIKTWVKQGLDKEWISFSTKKPVAYQNLWKYIWREFLFKKNPYGIKFRHINSHIHKQKSEKDIIKARFNYMKRNEEEISLEEFKKHSDRNDRVDKLAEKTRLDKTYFWEESSLLNTSIQYTRDGCIVIRESKGEENGKQNSSNRKNKRK